MKSICTIDSLFLVVLILGSVVNESYDLSVIYLRIVPHIKDEFPLVSSRLCYSMLGSVVWYLTSCNGQPIHAKPLDVE